MTNPSDSDVAIAIGESAFVAGFKAGLAAAGYDSPEDMEVHSADCWTAWSQYQPPEELCGCNFSK